MRVCTVLLAAVLVLTSPGAQAADLVVWWEKGFNPEEDDAIREIVAAFEKKAGKRVEPALYTIDELPGMASAAVEAGHPPDLVYGQDVAFIDYPRWAHDGRLVDLTATLGPLTAQYDRDALNDATLFDATAGHRGLYALPMGRITNHVHVWKSLFDRAGFSLADVPKEWEAFWSFFCDRVQPAVREALGRDDVWGVGLPMSFLPSGDTDVELLQFVAAYRADYVTRDGRLVIDEPAVRAGLIQALSAYTAVWRKGCVPPDAATWDNYGNNKAFLEQRVVMTVNNTLSIASALRATRVEDYGQNTATIEWPGGADGQPLAIVTQSSQVAVLRGGGHETNATEFVRFLVAEGWLAHWLDFAGDRFLPPMPALAEQPFWLDKNDPHRMMSAVQFLTRPRSYNYAVVSGEWRHLLVQGEGVWPKSVHRVVADGLSPEQAVDEAIARVKQILSE